MSHGPNSRAVQRRKRGLPPIPKTNKVTHGGRGKKYGMKGRKRARRIQ